MEKIKRLLNYLYPKLKSPFFVSMSVSVFVMFIIQDFLHFGTKLHFFSADFEKILYSANSIVSIIGNSSTEMDFTALYGIKSEYELIMFIIFYYIIKYAFIKMSKYDTKRDIVLTRYEKFKKFSMKLLIFLNVFALIVTPTVAARDLFLFLLPKAIDDSIYIECEIDKSHGGYETNKKWMFGKQVEQKTHYYSARSYCYNNQELKIKFSTSEKAQFRKYYNLMKILNPVYWIYFLYIVLRSLMGLSN